MREARGASGKRRRPAPRARAAAEAERILEVLRAVADGRIEPGRLDPEGFADPVMGRIAAAVGAASARMGREIADARERGKVIQEGINQTIEAMVRMVVRGDLSGELNIGVSDAELVPLVSGVSQAMQMLKRFVTEIREAALRLSAGSTEVLHAATQNESSTSQQASAVHETTATMEELQGASHQIAENAHAVAGIAEQTVATARQGEGAIRSFMEAMERVRHNAVGVDEAISRLSRRVERIGTVVEVIDEIADRSDLLALNAALEGAKAGDAGRGFSIVAAEMRRLAENVLESTKEIKNLIGEIREATQAAKDASDGNKKMAGEGERLGANAMSSVGGILKGIQETSDAARVIHLATQQQRTATEQVVQSMAEIEEVARQAQAGSRQATGAATELTRLAERLAELVRRFKVE